MKSAVLFSISNISFATTLFVALLAHHINSIVLTGCYVGILLLSLMHIAFSSVEVSNEKSKKLN
jgi:hypothetical protein